MNTLLGAFGAAFISFLNALAALFLNDPNLTIGMISQAAWIGIFVGAAGHFWKDYQAISARRLINKVTGTGDGGGTVG